MNSLINKKTKILKVSFYVIALFALSLLFPTTLSLDVNLHPIIGHLWETFDHFIPVYSILGGFIIASLICDIPLNVIALKKGWFIKNESWNKIYSSILISTAVLIVGGVVFYLIDNSFSPHPTYFTCIISVILFLVSEIVNGYKTMTVKPLEKLNKETRFNLSLIAFSAFLILFVISISLALTSAFSVVKLNGVITYNGALFAVGFTCSFVSAVCLKLAVALKNI